MVCVGSNGLTASIDLDGAYIIDLLPALPTAWSQGSVTGLRARGGFEVDLTWSEGKLEYATLRSQPGTRCVLAYQDRSKDIRLSPGAELRVLPRDF